MHHVAVERWSRRQSPLHARDARAKLGTLAVFLVAVSTAPVGSWGMFAAFGALLAGAAATAGLPPLGLLIRVLAVLPFTATFALLVWWSGDAARAGTLAAKSFLSISASLTFIATTPMTAVGVALETIRVPRTLVLVIQFLYRYLFVISEQAQHMRLAAAARRGAPLRRFHAAAGALGVLFVKSWERAEGVHRAMLARGFHGTFHALGRSHFHAADFAFLYLGGACSVAIRLAL